MGLWSAGYSSPYWLTFEQAKQLGGTVSMGEKANFEVWFDVRKAIEAKGEETEGEKVKPKVKTCPPAAYSRAW